MSDLDTTVADPVSITLPESWTVERARIASLSRSRPPDDPDLVAARRALREIRLADHIRRVVDEAPPLTEEQRARLAVLLRPSSVDGGAAMRGRSS